MMNDNHSFSWARLSSCTNGLFVKLDNNRFIFFLFYRFRLSEEEYEKKGDTLRSFLQRNKLGKYNEEEMKKLKEQQQKELEEEAK